MCGTGSHAQHSPYHVILCGYTTVRFSSSLTRTNGPARLYKMEAKKFRVTHQGLLYALYELGIAFSSSSLSFSPLSSPLFLALFYFYFGLGNRDKRA